jgi:hypothetical protein
MIPDYSDFWAFFYEFAAPRLAHRKESFELAFRYLSSLNRPACIVETGCVRQRDSFAGEGQSTVLFDQFSRYTPGSIVLSVDLQEQSTSVCRSIVSDRVQVFTMDSVKFLRHHCKGHMQVFDKIDLLYLDSFDVHFENPHDSAMHHLKELLAVHPLIGPQTFILIDDSPGSAGFFIQDGNIILCSPYAIGGKAKYVAKYMQDIGNQPVFAGYQVAWMGI